jgi:hypothetical protein
VHHDHVLMIEVSAVFLAIVTIVITVVVVAMLAFAAVAAIVAIAIGECGCGYKKGCKQDHQSASTRHNDLLFIG